MSATARHMSISLDGFVAGHDQGLEHPLGRRRARCATHLRYRVEGPRS
jgi:hypothetical protein